MKKYGSESNTAILAKARQLLPWGIQHRRYLHQHPELSLQEQQTAEYCARILQELGYTVKPSWGYGFTADWQVNPSYNTIALRADMDALPIQEQNKQSFISMYKNVMHACGHDMHMAIALTTAKLLAEWPTPLPNNVRFLFQPSEEKIPGGALGMIKQGCLAGVHEVFGLHNHPGLPCGTISTRAGALMAAGDWFTLKIIGRGCHAAKPSDGLNPLYPCAQLVIDWQAMIAQPINTTEYPAILSVTQFHAGDSAPNIIADTAYLGGTVRTFTESARQSIQNFMQQSIDAIAAQKYQCEFEYMRGYDPVVNSVEGMARIEAAARTILEEKQVNTNISLENWSEDFCYYLQHRPGAFYFLGSGYEANHTQYTNEFLHSPRFNIDENAISIGAAVMAALILC